MSSETVNGSIDLIRATPPFRPLAEILTSMVETKPRRWLKIRKLVRNLYTDILSLISETIKQAIICINSLVSAAYEDCDFPALIADHLSYILARRSVLLAIQREIYAFAPVLQESSIVQDPLDQVPIQLQHRLQVSYVKCRNSSALLFILRYLYETIQEYQASGRKRIVAAGKALDLHHYRG